MADLMSEAMRNALSIQVTGVGCEPDCDHAHATEPATTFLSFMVAKVYPPKPLSEVFSRAVGHE